MGTKKAATKKAAPKKTAKKITSKSADCENSITITHGSGSEPDSYSVGIALKGCLSRLEVIGLFTEALHSMLHEH